MIFLKTKKFFEDKLENFQLKLEMSSLSMTLSLESLRCIANNETFNYKRYKRLGKWIHAAYYKTFEKTEDLKTP